MGGARLAVTMGLVGMVAGAALAIGTVPAFRPYLERDKPVPMVVLSEDRARYVPAPEAQPDEGLRLRTGPEGGMVVELPRWAAQTGEWLVLGDRALRTWDEWTAPLRFDEPESWRDDAPDGAARDEGTWSGEGDRISDVEGTYHKPQDDAARAAEEARQAAQDVLAAVSAG